LPKKIVVRVKVPTPEEATKALKNFIGKLGTLEVTVEGKQVPVTKASKALKELIEAEALKELMGQLGSLGTKKKPAQKPEKKPKE
jgi:hypothetical protein